MEAPSYRMLTMGDHLHLLLAVYNHIIMFVADLYLLLGIEYLCGLGDRIPLSLVDASTTNLFSRL